MKSIISSGNRLRGCITLGVTLITIVLGASSARASNWQFFDSLETNVSSTWGLAHSGTGGGQFETAGAYSRSGINDAYIYVTSGFSSVGRTVNLTPYFAGRTLYTIAAIYLRPYGTNVNGVR